MVRQIIPVKKTAENDETVTYTWGHPGDEKLTHINKKTRAVQPGENTTEDESLFLLDWLQQVRQLNEMSDWPNDAPRAG